MVPEQFMGFVLLEFMNKMSVKLKMTSEVEIFKFYSRNKFHSRHFAM